MPQSALAAGARALLRTVGLAVLPAVLVLRENLRGLTTPLTRFGVSDAPLWAWVAVGLSLLLFVGVGLRALWPLLLVAGVLGVEALGWGAGGRRRSTCAPAPTVSSPPNWPACFSRISRDGCSLPNPNRCGPP